MNKLVIALITIVLLIVAIVVTKKNLPMFDAPKEGQEYSSSDRYVTPEKTFHDLRAGHGVNLTKYICDEFDVTNGFNDKKYSINFDKIDSKNVDIGISYYYDTKYSVYGDEYNYRATITIKDRSLKQISNPDKFDIVINGIVHTDYYGGTGSRYADIEIESVDFVY